MTWAQQEYVGEFQRFSASHSTDDKGNPLLSWRVHVLPQLGEEALYREFHLDEPWDSEHNMKLLEKMPDVFADPELTLEKGHTLFVGNSIKGGMFGPGKHGESNPTGASYAEVEDGTSNTVAFMRMTDKSNSIPWTKPVDLPTDDQDEIMKLLGLGKASNSKCILGFVDGSVRGYSNITAEQLKGILTISGGENVDDFVWGGDWR
ncbi:MAG: DUF1559 domain-containing protein [Pirellulaceae bacterium]